MRTSQPQPQPHHLLLLILFFISLCPPAFAQWTAVPVVEKGTINERINFLLLSEGYTEEELPQFRKDVEKVIVDIFSESPFREYRDFFNIITVEVASNESGASVPNEDIVRDTYFQATYGTVVERSMSLRHPVGTNRLYDIQMELNIGWWNGIVMVMVNDERPGGIPSIVARGMYNFLDLLHEAGHQFAQLADEYDDEAYQPVNGPNVTNETNRDFVKWRHWFRPEIPIPTPFHPDYFEEVGLFEGAAYRRFGWFRPQAFCKMKESQSPFCAVCNEQIIGRIYSDFNKGRILTTLPADSEVQLPEDRSLAFSFTGPEPEHKLDFTWLVNGLETGIKTSVFNFEGAQFGRGSHLVELIISDSSPQVKDPQLIARMTKTVSWEVTVSNPVSVGRSEPLYQDVYLGPNYPNPVRESTMISFQLQNASEVHLAIYDVLGRQIDVLASGTFPVGEHRVEWRPGGLASGVYFYSLSTNGQRITRRFFLAR